MSAAENEKAAGLILGLDGTRVSIQIHLIRRLGSDIAAAAFMSQAAYLSAISTSHKNPDGWFYLKQVGEPWVPPDGIPTIFSNWGSWESGLGISKDAQLSIRRKLIKLGLLEEKMMWVPGRLHYRIKLHEYIEFLTASPMNSPARGIPATEIRKSRDKKPEIPQQVDGNPANKKQSLPSLSKEGNKEGNKDLYACTAPPTADADADAVRAEKSVDEVLTEPQGQPQDQTSQQEKAGSSLPPVAKSGKFTRPHLQAGVICWDMSEFKQVASLIKEHGEGEVVDAAKKIAEDGRKPYVSYISKILKGENNGNCKRDFIANDRVGQQPAAVGYVDPYEAAIFGTRAG